MKRIPPPPVPTLAQRALELRTLPLEGAQLTFQSGRALLYRFYMKPGEFGRIYECELRVTPGTRAPEMIVLKPNLSELAGEAELPHVYPSKGAGAKLCLWLPRKREWQPHMSLIDTYIAWTSEWLWHFEDWLATGEWSGGGEHPSRRRRRWTLSVEERIREARPVRKGRT